MAYESSSLCRILTIGSNPGVNSICLLFFLEGVVINLL